MTTPEQTTVVMDASLAEFTQQVIDLAREGWELDEQNPPRMVGWQYEAHLWRNPTELQRAEQPKLSPAERMAKARAAKAEKAAVAKTEEQPNNEGGDPAPY